MLQRFYHQQSQLREKEAHRQQPHQLHHPQPVHYGMKRESHSSQMSGNEQNDQAANPFVRSIPKLTHKLNPFKQPNSRSNSPSDSVNLQNNDVYRNVPQYHVAEAVYANTNIPVYTKHYAVQQQPQTAVAYQYNEPPPPIKYRADIER